MRLITRLYELQEAHGYLSPETLQELARQEKVPLYRLQGLISFYPHFRTKPPARIRIAVCRDLACWLARGGHEAARSCRELASLPETEVREVSCLGRCDLAPAATLNDVPLTLRKTDSSWPPEILQVPTEKRQTVGNRPWRCDPYGTPDQRYGLFRELLWGEHNAAVARVLSVLKESGLRGMGGAGFPAGSKWELVRKETRSPKYVICNADESEPGTFKDRLILDELPHLVIEGMLLAGLVVGAEQGILYLRHEYGPERESFEAALAETQRLGLVGRNIQGTGFNFELTVFVSPGGYILGEETALLEALEDRRGEPRNKPPFPGTHGLFGQPTLINNAETLALVPAVVGRGASWWREQGKPGFAGLKFLSLSGDVERPGVYEVAGGTTLRELLALGGGVKGGRALKAFAPGGASSNWLPGSQADAPLDFEALARAGSMLGSGGVVVVVEGTDMLALATNEVRFFRNESCGKCVPCRLGTQRAVEILERVQPRAGRQELAILPDLAETLRLTSICGLGQVALNPIQSVLQHWPLE
jgi:NADH:ubiquinone oxidoreductase subunit F (NADH-binding)/NADH:ubiquinone oxidoreductase subunit E